MKLNENIIQKVNNGYRGDLNLRVADSLGDSSIYNLNWEICKLDQLTDMINSLTAMRDSIEQATGVRF